MTVFGAYSEYYDLFYQDKDYGAEVDYVHGLIQRFAPGARTLLELGCGTGRHGLKFRALDYRLTGVDVSPGNLAIARKRFSEEGVAPVDIESPPAVDLIEADIRGLHLEKRFDAVVSLFHVMSYQVRNQDLDRAFQAASAHLRPGGVFIFDVWYGPGVLTDRPQERVRTCHGEGVTVTRTARPTIDPTKNQVAVQYSFVLEQGEGQREERFSETHTMRYLFNPEIEALMAAHGLTPLFCFEWMSEKAPDFGSWTACFGARRD